MLKLEINISIRIAGCKIMHFSEPIPIFLALFQGEFFYRILQGYLRYRIK